MNVHKVAQIGFGLQARAYELARPSYPPAVVNYVTENFLKNGTTKEVLDLGKFGPDHRIVSEIAAGTGKWTRLLPKDLKRVVALEPSAEMRAQFKIILNDVDILDGTATSIPFADNSFDLITVAQAFHWFSNIESLREMHRVLKPAGSVALIWNMEDQRTPWVRRLRKAYEPYDGATPQYRMNLWRPVLESTEFKALFTQKKEVQFTHEVLCSRDIVWNRVLSKSYISVLPENEQAKLKATVEDMAQVGLSTYSKEILESFNAVKDPNTDTNWVLYSYDKDNQLKPFGSGDGGLEELTDEFNSSKIQYAFTRVVEPISGLPKIVMINWCGEGVPVSRKGLFNSHVNDIQRFFTGVHVAINARYEEDVTAKSIMKKVQDSSGAKYSIHQKGGAENLQPAPKPVATAPPPKPTPYSGAYLSKGTTASVPAAPAAPSIPSRPTPAPAASQAPPPPAVNSSSTVAPPPPNRRNDAPVDDLLDGDRKRIAERERRMRDDAEQRERAEQEQRDRDAREAAQSTSAASAAARQRETDSKISVAPPAQALPARPARPAVASPPAKTATAQYNYTPEESNEIELVEGDLITNIEQVDEQWWRGTVNGNTGLFPSSYVTINDPSRPSTPPEIASRPTAAIPKVAEVVAPPPAPRPVVAPPAAPPRPQTKTAIAQYDYEASEDNEISFSTGDVIEDVDTEVDEMWWKGRVNGTTGLFPANYVELQ
ncbi:hypothetical protein SmJEL517_g05379 [Synchytrium microbalum]|uniref:SH3 domain-containing protein n=1 Tax=Synchytrium microbalum TaxID=1806994 RepID=A0A507C121_9FUNG|nr:uncharacterized protein SmJEL517_g05379 [Synchytrium microbalum]TPX31265.1 hypothetical protein SmJEL517_g05379 [Synchytrium microbalum]